MITDMELASAISAAVSEYETDQISASILIHEVRSAIYLFDRQPTIIGEIEGVTL